jgi:ribosomal protein S18 acetylase RimI-like enzyme
MRKPELRWIVKDAAERAATLELRRAVLRRPLGLDFTEEQLAREGLQSHLGAFEGSRLLGCLLLQDMDEAAGQIRQVAVVEEARGLGVGRLLMLEAEAEARRRGLKRVKLHARDSAVPFYRKLGFRADGAWYDALGITHLDMAKDFDIRDAASADIAAIRALIFTHGANEWNHLPEASVTAHLDAIATGATLGIVSEENGALKGFCTYRPDGFICEAAVHRASAGKGLGTRLLLAAAARLFALGVEEVRADRHEENAASAGMMRKAGFEVISVYDDPGRRPTGSRRTALCRLKKGV